MGNKRLDINWNIILISLFIILIFVIGCWIGIFQIPPWKSQEEFNPNTDVCLKINAYHKTYFEEGRGCCTEITDLNHQSKVCVKETIQPCITEEIIDCRDWRPKNICELEPEAEHEECVCLEKEEDRKCVGRFLIEWDLEYENCAQECNLMEGFESHQKCMKDCWGISFNTTLKRIPNGCNINEICTKARLKNVCDNDPNYDGCECDEFKEREMDKFGLYFDKKAKQVEIYYNLYESCFEEYDVSPYGCSGDLCSSWYVIEEICKIEIQKDFKLKYQEYIKDIEENPPMIKICIKAHLKEESNV